MNMLSYVERTVWRCDSLNIKMGNYPALSAGTNLNTRVLMKKDEFRRVKEGDGTETS